MRLIKKSFNNSFRIDKTNFSSGKVISKYGVFYKDGNDYFIRKCIIYNINKFYL